MARARNIKPGFFKNEYLAAMEPMTRLLFIGLWTLADREGRLEYRPKRIWMELFPLEESYSVEDGIADLSDAGFLLAFEANGKTYLQVANWSKHQSPHHKEVGSDIPAPPGHRDTVCEGYIPLSNTIRRRIYERDGRVCKQCGAQHGLSIDHIIPISKGGNSVDDNLQVLCMTCNARKNNKLDARPMHKPCMTEGQANDVASCTTDSLIPDSLIRDISNPNGLDVAANAGDPPSGDTDESKGAKDAAQPASRCPLQKIVDLYHDALPMCPKVEKLTDTRAGYLRQRWREDLPTLEAWRNYFTDVSRSRFLTGKAEGRDGKPPFVADLEWLTRPGNFAKVAEGRYHR